PLYAAADLRIAVTPELLQEIKCEFYVALDLGRKARIDIESCTAGGADIPVCRKRARPADRNVCPTVTLTTGGGAEWESTLEEALLSLWHLPESQASTVV